MENVLLTISDTEIRDNQAATVGGGITLGLNAILTDTEISNNQAGGASVGHQGGGIYSIDNDIILHRVTMDGNTAYEAAGGGIFKSGGSLVISESELVRNTARSGGAVYPSVA